MSKTIKPPTPDDGKTIAIIITHGLIVRNILRTDVFKRLKEVKNVRILLVVMPLTSFHNNDAFKAEFESHNVTVINWPHKTNALEWLIRKVRVAIFNNTHPNATLRIKAETYRHKHPFKWFGMKIGLTLLGKGEWKIKALEGLDKKLFGYKNSQYLKELGALKPDLVFDTDFLCSYGWGLVKAAQAAKIPVVAMVASWDHLTTKGMLPTRYDKVICWNGIIKKQLKEMYGYRDKDILVSGVPQFDCYHGFKVKKPKRKRILYTTSTPTLAPYEQEVVEKLASSLIGPELIVRLHPADNPGRYDYIQGVKFEAPGNSADYEKYVWDPSSKDMEHFANLLSSSSVVVNVCSTTTIDAACFDTPVVNIAFDGNQKRPYWDSVSRYYDYTHYVDVVETKGVKIAHIPAGVIYHINRYLENPSLDGHGRQEIVRKFCHKLDGKSGRRIGKFLLKQAGVSG